MEGSVLEKLPTEWVERIFERLAEIYGEPWTRHYVNPEKKSLNVTMWSTGLAGLTIDQIKSALALLRHSPGLFPPTVIEFYHYAKGIRKPYRYQPKIRKGGSTEIASGYINEIKNKLKHTNSSVLREQKMSNE